ncbi:hypothetical protein HRG95_10190 [Enterococcus faecalis]|nr:hypothetical protein [Enterococcus faecalis]
MIPKYRAWDDINEKMIYDFYRETIETIDGWYKGELVVRNKNEIHCDLLYSSKEEYLFRHVKELPLMQSTSLKDKNGVESWEGNYLTKEGCWPFFIKRIENEGCLMAVPVNRVQRINWNPVPVKKLLEMDYANDGNIYKNPELLEVAE